MCIYMTRPFQSSRHIYYYIILSWCSSHIVIIYAFHYHPYRYHRPHRYSVKTIYACTRTYIHLYNRALVYAYNHIRLFEGWGLSTYKLYCKKWVYRPENQKWCFSNERIWYFNLLPLYYIMYLRWNKKVFNTITSKLHIIPSSRGIWFYLTSLGKILYHIIIYTALKSHITCLPIYHT